MRVTTSTSMSALVMDGVVGTYLAKHAKVRVDLHASERRMGIVREGFDLAVWAGALEDSSLVARKLGVASGGSSHLGADRSLRPRAEFRAILHAVRS